MASIPHREADESLREYCESFTTYIHPCPNTDKAQLHPHIKYVMEKYKHKLERDELKKFAREVSKTV